MPPADTLGNMDRDAVIESLRAECRLVEQLQVEVQHLKDENKRLLANQRTEKSSATPFSKNKPKADPKRPGRVSGKGRFAFRTAPVEAPQDEVRHVDVPLDQPECPQCGGPLEVTTETATTVDLPTACPRVITKFNVQIGRCPHCQITVRGTHPDLPNDQQGATAHRIGHQCKALGLGLHYDLGVPQRKVPTILEMLTGITLTQSALNQCAAQLCAPEAPATQAYDTLRAAIQQAPVVNTDDTGWKIGGQPAYLMGFFSKTLAVYQIRTRHRHEEVREMLGIDFAGLLGTDRGPSYDAKDLAEIPMQKCLSHLLKNIS